MQQLGKPEKLACGAPQAELPFDGQAATQPHEPHFNGPDYVPQLDFERLSGQLADIFHLMKDGGWRTLGEIASATGHGEASISAQLRHLRKDRFGSHTVRRQRRGELAGGLYEYSLLVNREAQ